MHILVTGGAGYVGSALVPHLLAEGHTVRVLDTFRHGGASLLGCCGNDRFDFVQGDICDEATVGAALKDMDAIVHLAAVVGFTACSQEPAYARMTNIDGTLNLLNFRRADQPILFASTGSAYGIVTSGICTEETSTAPRTLYARTKEAGERLVLDAGNAIVRRLSA